MYFVFVVRIYALPEVTALTVPEASPSALPSQARSQGIALIFGIKRVAKIQYFKKFGQTLLIIKILSQSLEPCFSPRHSAAILTPLAMKNAVSYVFGSAQARPLLAAI